MLPAILSPKLIRALPLLHVPGGDLPTLAGGIQTPVPSDQSTVRGGRVCSRKGRHAALVSFAPVRAPWQLPHMRLVDLAPKLAGALNCSLILSVGKGRTSRGTGVRGVLVVDEPRCGPPSQLPEAEHGRYLTLSCWAGRNPQQEVWTATPPPCRAPRYS